MDPTGQCGPLTLQNEVCHLFSPRKALCSPLLSAEHTVKSVSAGTTASSLNLTIPGANSMIQYAQYLTQKQQPSPVQRRSTWVSNWVHDLWIQETTALLCRP